MGIPNNFQHGAETSVGDKTKGECFENGEKTGKSGANDVASCKKGRSTGIERLMAHSGSRMCGAFYDEREDFGFDGFSDETEEKCMYCGYPIERGEEKAKVLTTGDVIHKTCWIDYAEDNFDELCTLLDDDGDDAYGCGENGGMFL